MSGDRKIPEFGVKADIDAFDVWLRHWEKVLRDDDIRHRAILDMMRGVAAESGYYIPQRNDRELKDSMNDLISKLDQYASNPNNPARKQDVLDVLARIPKDGWQMGFDIARTLFTGKDNRGMMRGGFQAQAVSENDAKGQALKQNTKDFWGARKKFREYKPDGFVEAKILPTPFAGKPEIMQLELPDKNVPNNVISSSFGAKGREIKAEAPEPVEPMRVAPYFHNVDDLKGWRDAWQEKGTDTHILGLIEAIYSEANAHILEYLTTGQKQMDDLIEAVEAYAGHPADQQLRRNVLDALKNVAPLGDAFFLAKTWFMRGEGVLPENDPNDHEPG